MMDFSYDVFYCIDEVPLTNTDPGLSGTWKTPEGERTIWFACVRGSAAWRLRVRRARLHCRCTGELRVGQGRVVAGWTGLDRMAGSAGLDASLGGATTRPMHDATKGRLHWLYRQAVLRTRSWRQKAMGAWLKKTTLFTTRVLLCGEVSLIGRDDETSFTKPST